MVSSPKKISVNEIIYTANILQIDMQVNMTASFFKILCNKLKKHTLNVVFEGVYM